MFQSDDQPGAAGSGLAPAQSQQSSSALSVHRLSRAKAYALFVAFVLFASWYSALAQVQTGISLLLLAIIGLFLGNATRPRDAAACQQQHSKQRRRRQPQSIDSTMSKCGRGSTNSGGSTSEESSGGSNLSVHKLKGRLKASGASTTFSQPRVDDGATLKRPLLRSQACAAAGKLSEHQQGDTCKLRNDQEEQRVSARADQDKVPGEDAFVRQRIAKLRPDTAAATTAAPEPLASPSSTRSPASAAPQAASVSPSSPSAGSAASTGYNSDSHHSTSNGAAATPLSSLAGGAAAVEPENSGATTATTIHSRSDSNSNSDPDSDDGTTLEMIELVRGRQTAMRAIFSQLAASPTATASPATLLKLNESPNRALPTTTTAATTDWPEWKATAALSPLADKHSQWRRRQHRQQQHHCFERASGGRACFVNGTCTPTSDTEPHYLIPASLRASSLVPLAASAPSPDSSTNSNNVDHR